MMYEDSEFAAQREKAALARAQYLALCDSYLDRVALWYRPFMATDGSNQYAWTLAGQYERHYAESLKSTYSKSWGNWRTTSFLITQLDDNPNEPLLESAEAAA